MKEIALTRGLVAKVDDGDFDWLSAFNWSADQGSRTSWAIRSAWVDGHRTTVQMHREILRAPKGVQVDHINGDGLDNRRANLRIATYSQNQGNRHVSRQGFRGVSKRDGRRYSAGIYKFGTRHSLGTYATAEEAARAYGS